MKFYQPSSTIKSLIIAALKRKRPNGLYISEFLVPNRLKLFHDVRIYAKDYVDQIDRVFTRGEVIFIRNKVTGRIVVIDNNEDFDKVKHEFSKF